MLPGFGKVLLLRKEELLQSGIGAFAIEIDALVGGADQDGHALPVRVEFVDVQQFELYDASAVRELHFQLLWMPHEKSVTEILRSVNEGGLIWEAAS